MTRRSMNGHQAKVRRLPFVARLRRERPLRSADEMELEAAAAHIAGVDGWYSSAGWRPEDVDCRLIRFASQAEADALEKWIAESGIASRPPPGRWIGPQLTTEGGTTNGDGGNNRGPS